MGFPATKSSVSQIIEKLDSLPNSARDTAVNNSIVPSDNLAGLGESVLKLYSESNPSAREAIAEMFELVCNEPFDNWLDRVERSCDGFSKQKEVVREFDSPPEAIADALDSEGWTVSDDDVRNLGYLEIERDIEAVCQIVTSAWDEKTATDDIHSESLDQICEHASDAIDESASICVDMQLDSGVVR